MDGTETDIMDLQIQKNVTNWQSGDNLLAPLTEEQLDIIYEIGDVIKREYNKIDVNTTNELSELTDMIPEINTNRAYIKWLLKVEDEIKYESFDKYKNCDKLLKAHVNKCEVLLNHANLTFDLLQELHLKYYEVAEKTDSLHSLSEQLMKHQKILKENRMKLDERLYYFINFNKIQENVEKLNETSNLFEFIDTLNIIDRGIEYMEKNMNFKESRIYKIKYHTLLINALNNIQSAVGNVIVEATKQIVDPEIASQNPNQNFSLYYGKFQSASVKVKQIIAHLENKIENENYKAALLNCRNIYVGQRLPTLNSAVSKALLELKEKHKNDCSVLFRSCGSFTMKMCQDEIKCYHYFFELNSKEFKNYLGILCQHLYDILRPSLISINHIEILCELCGILRKEMLNEKIYSDEYLTKYTEITKQLLGDAEERLVFRTNVFLKRDLLAYNPSPGDLAYPEKLKQLENITDELQEFRADSQSSMTSSVSSQEVASINSQALYLRSYTGNSPADLHGMWYPTVKRTLVILSRLYFCLDKAAFQGLAQEALLDCALTIEKAAHLIASKKSKIDGTLFQIKHLLIIREQIVPFQVDFTAKEMSLDFSTVQKAAVELLHKRNKLFTFSSNNALLEFLLEGTPRVKEYLIDSRKEIDKQLKQSCELFIFIVTDLLIKSVLNFIGKLEISKELLLPAKKLSEIISEILRNMKTRIPEIQKLMQLYLANRETEFILFRPIKNNIINTFIQLEQVISKKYNEEDQLVIGCPSPEQVNVLICSVSLTGEVKVNQ